MSGRSVDANVHGVFKLLSAWLHDIVHERKKKQTNLTNALTMPLGLCFVLIFIVNITAAKLLSSPSPLPLLQPRIQEPPVHPNICSTHPIHHSHLSLKIADEARALENSCPTFSTTFSAPVVCTKHNLCIYLCYGPL